MNRHMRKAVYGILMIFLVLGFVGYAFAGTDVKVVGTVGDDNTITDDSGAVYQIGDNDKTDEIAEHAGKKVEIMGTVEEASDGSKTIMINSYKLVE
jgi:hypothetical protein